MDIITRKEARAQGLKHYFTGKPCPRGHTSIRRASNAQCIQCGRENALAYRVKHIEGVKQKLREYYAKTKAAMGPELMKEKNNLRMRRYRSAHGIKKKESDRSALAQRIKRLQDPEAARDKGRANYARNADKVCEYMKGYRKTPLGRLRYMTAEANRRLCLNLSSGRTASLPYTADEYIAHLESTLPEGWTYNFAKSQGYEVDHIIPIRYINSLDISAGEKFQQAMELSNLRMIHFSPNRSKGSKLLGVEQ